MSGSSRDGGYNRFAFPLDDCSLANTKMCRHIYLSQTLRLSQFFDSSHCVTSSGVFFFPVIEFRGKEVLLCSPRVQNC